MSKPVHPKVPLLNMLIEHGANMRRLGHIEQALDLEQKARDLAAKMQEDVVSNQREKRKAR